MLAGKQYDIFQVDAFSDTLFMGNPAAVVPLKNWLNDDTMQQIANENNLAETAFFVPEGQGFYIRWFTPSKEVDLCGHATLAAAHVLYEHLEYRSPICRFRTQSRGTLEVRKLLNGYIMDFPSDHIKEVTREKKAHLASLLGVDINECFRGRDDFLVVFPDEKSVRNYRPDFVSIAKLEARGVIITAMGDEMYDIVSRCFFPKYGINEDPVTGSAHTLLAPFWCQKLEKKEIIALQASPRTGIIYCACDADRVHLRGDATTFLVGQIYL